MEIIQCRSSQHVATRYDWSRHFKKPCHCALLMGRHVSGIAKSQEGEEKRSYFVYSLLTCVCFVCIASCN